MNADFLGAYVHPLLVGGLPKEDPCWLVVTFCYTRPASTFEEIAQLLEQAAPSPPVETPVLSLQTPWALLDYAPWELLMFQHLGKRANLPRRQSGHALKRMWPNYKPNSLAAGLISKHVWASPVRV